MPFGNYLSRIANFAAPAILLSPSAVPIVANLDGLQVKVNGLPELPSAGGEELSLRYAAGMVPNPN